MAKKAKQTVFRKPRKTIDSTTLGTLRLTAVLDEHLEYTALCDLDGNPTELVLYSKANSEEMDETIEWASKLVSAFKTVKPRLNRYIGTVVLKGINTHLRPGDPLTAAALKRQLTLEVVNIHANGEAAFWYGAGDVLLGHGLVLYGKSDGTINDYDTPG